MKTGRIFWGVFLLLVGVLFLAQDLLPLDLDWTTVWRFWPLAIVLAGVSLLIRKHPARVIVAVLAAALLALAVYSLFSFLRPYSTHGPGGREFTETINVPLEPRVTSASLSLDVGAGKCLIRGGGEQLLDARASSSFGRYLLDQRSDDSSEILEIRFKSGPHSWRLWRADNTIDLRLSDAPLWRLRLGCGAARADLDLSSCRVEDLQLEAGASSISVKLGALVPESRVRIEAGVSSIRFEVPESAGCEIRTDAPLTSKRFSGFEKESSGLYRTGNFSNADRRIFIQIEAGVSSVKVRRYL